MSNINVNNLSAVNFTTDNLTVCNNLLNKTGDPIIPLNTLGPTGVNVNLAGTSGPAPGSANSTSPALGEEWVNQVTGDRYIFNGTQWDLTPAPSLSPVTFTGSLSYTLGSGACVVSYSAYKLDRMCTISIDATSGFNPDATGFPQTTLPANLIPATDQFFTIRYTQGTVQNGILTLQTSGNTFISEFDSTAIPAGTQFNVLRQTFTYVTAS